MIAGLLLCCLLPLSASLLSERCPKLSWPLNEESCTEESCQSDDDCEGNAICCPNGCIKACYTPDNVLAFDWSEEPSDYENTGEQKEEIEEGTVSLPGGCILSREQYNRFEDFKNNEYIEKCFCKLGNILCQVSHK
ncbi:uncharacterized protein [Halyomorpha halys]|uniref:uncharacterized protein isoform X2 n=1 Tax=Halyomorpha halys TaxID=286706 RepID=UPI0034D292D2